MKIVITMVLLVFLFSCQKEKNLYKPYLGTWYARGCAANGGPMNCGLPYPIPKEMDITLSLHEDQTFMKTFHGDTVRGSYLIRTGKHPNGNNMEIDILIKTLNGTSSEHYIAIEADGALSIYENCCTKYFYVK